MQGRNSQLLLGSVGPLPLEHVLSYVHGGDVISAIPVNPFWAEVATSDTVWSVKCAALWADKVYVPQRFLQVTSHNALRRIEAYWGSLADSRRIALSPEELCSFEWSCRMKESAGQEWTRRDPWWRKPPQPANTRRYSADGTTSSAQGAGTWRFVPGSSGMLGPLGSFIRHGRGDMEFPTHFVSRWAANWGWIVQNCWGFSASFPLPPRGEEPALEDNADLCQRVTVDTCSEEATRFNLGFPLPYSVRDETSENRLDGELVNVIINGRRRRLPCEAILRLMQEGEDETDEHEAEADAHNNAADENMESEFDFDDDESLPDEAADTSSDGVRLGRVRLLSVEAAFCASFGRFQGDEVNGYTEEKRLRLGQEATVTEVYGDRTVTCVFDDGASLDFPWESVAEQLSITDDGIDHFR